MKIKLEYYIRRRDNLKYFDRREILLDVESVLNGLRDELSFPSGLDAKDFEFVDFQLTVDGEPA